MNKDGKWKTIAKLLGHVESNEVATQLQKIYEKTLLPYDVVISGAASNRDQVNQSNLIVLQINQTDIFLFIKKFPQNNIFYSEILLNWI